MPYRLEPLHLVAGGNRHARLCARILKLGRVRGEHAADWRRLARRSVAHPHHRLDVRQPCRVDADGAVRVESEAALAVDARHRPARLLVRNGRVAAAHEIEHPFDIIRELYVHCGGDCHHIRSNREVATSDCTMDDIIRVRRAEDLTNRQTHRLGDEAADRIAKGARRHRKVYRPVHQWPQL